MQPGVTKPFFIFVHRFLGKFPKRIESPFDRDTPQISCCKTRRRPRARNSNTPPAMRFSAVISPIPVRSGTNPSLTQSCPARMKKQVMRHTYRRTRHRIGRRPLSLGRENSFRPTHDTSTFLGLSVTARAPEQKLTGLYVQLDRRELSVTQTRIAVRSRNTRPAITCARSTSGPR